ncbi:gem-associated protein 7 [Antechinus flavipes]|uniref:gem-associated protein 7 n=1 Tax=Antechinus flavipes TaxID=38775 RepID=UPI0022358C32|nr:gem-associated protein 7 [Antechinus flavipes]XP_051845380.1 gem-associated protein 7 [Antechinus flavipes]
MPEKELTGAEPVGKGRVVSYRREAPLPADQAPLIPTPVPVIRLPRGPDGTSRGFSAARGRDRTGSAAEVAEQEARAALRERYLRSVLAMVGRPVHFTLHERVHVDAHFGATDLDVANFHVSQLQTPLGVQGEALLRCADIISYSFQL